MQANACTNYIKSYSALRSRKERWLQLLSCKLRRFRLSRRNVKVFICFSRTKRLVAEQTESVPELVFFIVGHAPNTFESELNFWNLFLHAVLYNRKSSVFSKLSRGINAIGTPWWNVSRNGIIVSSSAMINLIPRDSMIRSGNTYRAQFMSEIKFSMKWAHREIAAKKMQIKVFCSAEEKVIPSWVKF